VAEFVRWAKKEGPILYRRMRERHVVAPLGDEYFRCLPHLRLRRCRTRRCWRLVADLLAGRVQRSAFGFDLPGLLAGKPPRRNFRARLAVSTSKPFTACPRRQNLVYPRLGNLTTDFVSIGAGGTPDEIVALLEREVRQAISTTEFRERASAKPGHLDPSFLDISRDPRRASKGGLDLWGGPPSCGTGMKGE